MPGVLPLTRPRVEDLEVCLPIALLRALARPQGYRRAHGGAGPNIPGKGAATDGDSFHGEKRGALRLRSGGLV
jgi:hypothetical protein